VLLTAGKPGIRPGIAVAQTGTADSSPTARIRGALRRSSANRIRLISRRADCIPSDCHRLTDATFSRASRTSTAGCKVCPEVFRSIIRVDLDVVPLDELAFHQPETIGFVFAEAFQRIVLLYPRIGVDWKTHERHREEWISRLWLFPHGSCSGFDAGILFEHSFAQARDDLRLLAGEVVSFAKVVGEVEEHHRRLDGGFVFASRL
jgi:hypothetical protein